MTSYAHCIVCGKDLKDDGLVTFCVQCSLRLGHINEIACGLYKRFPNLDVDWYDVAEDALVAAGAIEPSPTNREDHMTILDRLRRISGFDFNKVPIDKFPRGTKWFKRLWEWWSDQTTGNAQHAINGLLPWAIVQTVRCLVTWEIPDSSYLLLTLAVYWPFPFVFYSFREIIDLVTGEADDPVDNLADFAWVYAVGAAVWFPGSWYGYTLAPWLGWTLIIQAIYYSEPAPPWMKEKLNKWNGYRLLWSHDRRKA